jgi:hypothetical protein
LDPDLEAGEGIRIGRFGEANRHVLSKSGDPQRFGADKSGRYP